jgi:prepilin-type processing-associated H-X9-DG protein
MKTSRIGNSARALTLFEVLLMVTVLMLIAAFLLPSIARPRRISHISCANNQKQVGLAYRIWAGDNLDRYPMSVSINQGGSMELVLAGDILSTFRAMSNELNTPMILYCPSDYKRQTATNFAFLLVTNVSYFVGVDAAETNDLMFLSGDRNITNGTRLHSGLLPLTTNRLCGWTDEIHQKQGNVGLADGSVQQFSTSGLRSALESTGVATNRLAMP